jgi:hypothetical protein
MAQSPTAQRKRTGTSPAAARRKTERKDDATRGSAAASARTQSAAAKSAPHARDGHGGAAHRVAGLVHHTAHATVPIPYLTPADLAATARTAVSHLPTHLPSAVPTGRPGPAPRPAGHPSRERLALYGGLGALAVAGAVEWPVALAIGAATAVARSGRHEAEPARERTPHGKRAG